MERFKDRSQTQASAFRFFVSYLFFIFAIPAAQSSDTAFKRYDEVTRNWEYTCDEENWMRVRDPLIELKLKSFAETVIDEGLYALSQLNPELAELVVKRTEGLHVRFLCEDDPNAIAGSLAATWRVRGVPSWFLSYRVYLGAVAKYVSNVNSYSSEFERQYHSQVLFHEFLHFAEIDNFSEEKHNDNHRGIRGYFQDDLVYACSTSAFPNAVTLIFGWPRATKLDTRLNENGKKNYLIYGKRPCLTCASNLLGMEDATGAEKYRHTQRALEKCEYVQDIWVDF